MPGPAPGEVGIWIISLPATLILATVTERDGGGFHASIGAWLMFAAPRLFRMNLCERPMCSGQNLPRRCACFSSVLALHRLPNGDMMALSKGSCLLQRRAMKEPGMRRDGRRVVPRWVAPLGTCLSMCLEGWDCWLFAFQLTWTGAPFTTSHTPALTYSTPSQLSSGREGVAQHRNDRWATVHPKRTLTSLTQPKNGV